jgi:two-component system, NarL family, sensor kinase
MNSSILRLFISILAILFSSNCRGIVFIDHSLLKKSHHILGNSEGIPGISQHTFWGQHGNLLSIARELTQEDTLMCIREKALGFNLMGLLSGQTHLYDSAMFYFQNAYGLAAEIEDYDLLCKIVNNIGITHWNAGSYKQALEYYFRALSYLQLTGNDTVAGGINNNIGLVYFDLKDFEKAGMHFREGYRYHLDSNNPTGLSASLINLSELHLATDQPDSAMFYIERILAHTRQNDCPFGACIAYELKGRAFLEMENFTKAEFYFEKSLFYGQTTNSSTALLNAFIGLLQVRASAGEYHRGLSLKNKTLELAQACGSYKSQIKAHTVFAILHEMQGDSLLALKHYSQVKQIRDNYLKQTYIHRLYEYELSKVEGQKLQELRFLARDKELQSLKINRQATLIILFLILVVFASLGSILLVHIIRQKQSIKFNNTLLGLNAQLSYAAIMAESRERKRIGTELQLGLGQVLSSSQKNISELVLNINHLQNSKILLDQALGSVDKAFYELRLVSNYLAPPELSADGLEGALKDLFLQINKSGHINIQLQTIGMPAVIDQIVSIILYRAIQELIHHAIRFSWTREILVQLVGDQDQLTITLEDCGGDYVHNHLLSIHEPGLEIVRTYINTLNGSFSMDFSEIKGGIFILMIPLKRDLCLNEYLTDLL